MHKPIYIDPSDGHVEGSRVSFRSIHVHLGAQAAARATG